MSNSLSLKTLSPLSIIHILEKEEERNRLKNEGKLVNHNQISKSLLTGTHNLNCDEPFDKSLIQWNDSTDRQYYLSKINAWQAKTEQFTFFIITSLCPILPYQISLFMTNANHVYQQQNRRVDVLTITSCPNSYTMASTLAAFGSSASSAWTSNLSNTESYLYFADIETKQRKKTVIILSRVHPSESGSSFVVQGKNI